MHVFLVEDDDSLRLVTERMLNKRGFQVTTASSLSNAETIINHWQSSELPEAAILDLKLGNELSLPLIEILLKSNKHIKILILTGYASIATAVQAVKLGATNYLPKPASLDDMLQALELSQHSKHSPIANEDKTIVSTQRLEWEHIQRVLTNNNGNISAAARELNMHRRTLQRKLQKHPHKK